MAKEKSPITYGDGFADIELTREAEIGGVKVKQLRMREPSVEDQLVANAMKGSDLDKDIGYFANLCGVTPDDIKRLPLRSYKRVQDAFFGLTD